jgi:hypothetical protein
MWVPDHVLDVGEGRAVYPDEPLDVLGTALQDGAVGLAGEVLPGEDPAHEV